MRTWRLHNGVFFKKKLNIATAGKRDNFMDLFAPTALCFCACFATSWYRSVANSLELVLTGLSHRRYVSL